MFGVMVMFSPNSVLNHITNVANVPLGHMWFCGRGGKKSPLKTTTPIRCRVIGCGWYMMKVKTTFDSANGCFWETTGTEERGAASPCLSWFEHLGMFWAHTAGRGEDPEADQEPVRGITPSTYPWKDLAACERSGRRQLVCSKVRWSQEDYGKRYGRN